MSTPLTGLGSLLAEHPILKACSRLQLARLLTQISELKFDSGSTIVQRGDEADTLYVLLDGSVARLANDGRKAYTSGGFFAEEAALGIPKYSVTIQAESPVRVVAIPNDAILSAMQDTPTLRDDILLSYHHAFDETPQDSIPRQDDSLSAEKANWKALLGWLLVVLWPVVIYLVMDKSTEESLTRLEYIMVAGSTIFMWVFKLLPEFVPALFAVVVLILLGTAPPKVALSGFESHGFFIAMSIFGLSAVITSSGLSYRLLLLLLRIGPQRKSWYGFSLFITGAALTPMVPSTDGRVSIVGSLTKNLMQSLDPETRLREATRLGAMALGGVSLLSATFLSSKTINFVVFGYLPQQEQQQFEWMYWLFATSFVSVIAVVLYSLVVNFMFRSAKGDSRSNLDKKLISEQLRILGPLSKSEWAAITGLLVLLVSFLTVSWHQIDVAWVALVILLGLLIFDFLNSTDFKQQINWSYLVFLGCLVGMVAVMQYIHLDKWITVNLSWLTDEMAKNFVRFIFELALAIFLIRFLLPINATVIVFATLLIPAAINVGVNTWLVGFLILFFSETFVLPYQAGYYVNFCNITGLGDPAREPRIALLNFLVFVIKVVAVFASIIFWKELGLL